MIRSVGSLSRQLIPGSDGSRRICLPSALVHTTRQIYNSEYEIDTTYNEHGDIASEITRGTQPRSPKDSAEPAKIYSEVRYSYEYDDHGNWVQKTTSGRPRPDGALQDFDATTRILTYY